MRTKTHPLKVERELRGWSQARVAEAVGTNVRTVIRWEQGKSVPYPYYREQLCALFGKNARELGLLSEETIPDEEVVATEAQGMQKRQETLDTSSVSFAPSLPFLPPVAVAPAPLASPTATMMLPTTNSPADDIQAFVNSFLLWNVPPIFTPLIGRERELDDIKALLTNDHMRLVTLTGEAGIGKTQLSIQLAHELSLLFTHGICFVHLTTDEAEQVMPLIARELELRDEKVPARKQVIQFLHDKHMLLVLDNFEQVVQAASELEDLLIACPSIKLLVTSRVVLHIASEYQYRVLPLALPNVKERLDVFSIEHAPAVELFVQRARSLLPTFQITASNAAIIADICVRLDGLPLAIELAAARVRLMPLPLLLSRLSQSLELLTKGLPTLPERQQTLRSAIRWSYDLLDEDEQYLFRVLSVFVDSFTLEHAEALFTLLSVGNTSLNVLNGLDSFVDKSLLYSSVSTSDVQEPRLAMLEAIRAFGREQLIAHGELERVQCAYAGCYLNFAEKAEQELSSSQQTQQAAWLQRLEQEYAHIRATMEWMLSTTQHSLNEDVSMQRQEMALRLSNALSKFWLTHGHLREGWSFIEQSLLRYEGAVTSTLAQACALGAQIGMRLGNIDRAASLLEQSKQYYETLDDRGHTADVIRLLGWIAHQKNQTLQAYYLYEQAVALYKEQGLEQGIANTLLNMAFIMQTRGDYQQARTMLEEVVTRQRAIKNTSGTFSALYQLAEVLLGGEEHPPFLRIRALLNEGLALAESSGNRMGVASMQGLLGRVALQEGKLDEARSLLDQCLLFYREGGDMQVTGQYIAALGNVALAEGKYAEAQSLFEESMSLAKRIEEKTELVAVALEGMAQLAVQQGNHLWAIRLWAAAGRWRDDNQMYDMPGQAAVHERELARAEEFLGKKAYDALWREGSAMSPDDAISARYAPLPEQQTAPLTTRTRKKTSSYPAGLSAREVEVLRLVSQGLSDAEVAEQLKLSTRTVTTHLTSIYNKIGISSRAAAVRFAAEHHLL